MKECDKRNSYTKEKAIKRKYKLKTIKLKSHIDEKSNQTKKP
jgi:hypothetical protein